MATRRTFLKAAGGALAVGRSVLAAEKPEKKQQAGGAPTATVPKGTYQVPTGRPMPTRELGRTGVKVSILGLGGYHLGIPDEAEATRIVHTALDHGLNFLDNCWDYHDGESERRMGKALKDGWRKKAFVMTKLDGRTAKAATGQLEQSLQRLQTDVIDLVQVHEVIRPDDAERVFAQGGAAEALLAARKAGKLRFIGFTGHKDPDIHRHMLEVARQHDFHFDTVQMPINVLDAHYRSFERDIIPLAAREGTAVLGMKSLGAGLILKTGVASAPECLRYAMSVPGVSVTITGCDSEGVLEQALALALDFKPLTDGERRALLGRTAAVAKRGDVERFKTTQDFDGTTQNPRWLTDAKM
ncbi:MAG: aldo/keto reductase [Archangiaceae bacterium]|nr:aldo/keto reductase [Archangiaceae bacterium]